MRYKNGFKKRLYKDEVEPHDKDPDTSDTGDEDLDKPSKRPKPKPTDEDTNWLQYFNEIKAEEQEAHPNNLESDDDPFEQIPVKTGNYTQSPIQETAPQTNSTLLNDKLTMAKINLLQKQAILAEKQSDVCDREMKFVEEKTKFLQKKCHCDLAILQHLN